MSEKEPETDDLDAGWDDEGDEEAPPATRAVESLELRRMAQHAVPSRAPSTPPPRPDHPTMPPPVPPSEYVATMMRGVPESADAPNAAGTRETVKFPRVPTLAERHRAILQTLHEEDPLRFDFDDSEVQVAEGDPVSSEAPRDSGVLGEGPYIETSVSGVDDLDPELLKDTPVPPPPGEGDHGDELDELPVDEVLESVRLSGAVSERRPRGVGEGRPEKSQTSRTPEGDGYEVSLSDLPMDLPPSEKIRSFETEEAAPEAHSRATLPPYDPNDPLDRIHDRFVVGDYSGALVLAEGVLEEQPDNSEAQRYAVSCRDMLRQMYLSRIGSGRHVPRLIMGPEQLRWLTLDHRAGFLLSCVDGRSSIDEILDVSGMPGLDALRLLYELVQEGVIEVDERRPG